MYYTDSHTIERLTALREDAARLQAQSLSLRRQAGLVDHGTWSAQAGQLLHHVGHRLVVLGEWLEQVGSPQPSY